MNRLLALVALGAISIVDATGSTLPSRDECVVGYSMDWSRSSRNPSDVLNDLAVPSALANAVHLAGLATPSSAAVYFQFTTSCQDRVALADRIIAEWRRVEGSPSFTVITERITIGPGTIDIRGPHWRN